MMRTFDFQKMPIVDVLNEILIDSSKKGASDIHFDPFPEYLLVRIRIDGVLHDYTKIPDDVRGYLVTRIKTVARMNITESRLPQDGAIKDTLGGIDLDLRVSSLPVNGGEKVVIRILDYSRSMAGLDELSFSEKNFTKLLEMISVPNGIILVTGATGSGKSTTVYSILQHLNKPETNIITVEDPIEMDISGINQVQTNSKVGLTFASALRSILRQDPDIIMIGEIRDSETAKIAVRASITGHLVLSTLHTNTALNTIERLIDMDVQKYLLSSALEGVISQKLARRLCNNCKRKRETTNYEKQIFKTVLNLDVDEIWEAEGCEQCHGGFSGRVPIHEVLKITQRIRDALGEDLPKEKFRDLVYGHGDVITMLQDGLEKVVEGHTTFGEILKLIELEDDDQISGNSALKEAILETKAAMTSKDDKDKVEVLTMPEDKNNASTIDNSSSEEQDASKDETIKDSTSENDVITSDNQNINSNVSEQNIQQDALNQYDGQDVVQQSSDVQYPEQNTVRQEIMVQYPNQSIVEQQPAVQYPEQSIVEQQPIVQNTEQYTVEQQPAVQYPEQYTVEQQPAVQYPEQNTVRQEIMVQYPNQSIVEQQPAVQYPEQYTVEQQPTVQYPEQYTVEQQPVIQYPEQYTVEQQPVVQYPEQNINQ